MISFLGMLCKKLACRCGCAVSQSNWTCAICDLTNGYAAGARATATLLHEMNKRGKASRFGVVSMCIGSGMGAAAVFERGGEVDAFRNAAPTSAQGFLSHDARV